MRFRRVRERFRVLIRPLRRYEIDPDEVLLDARNLPAFDTSQFEGRIEAPIRKITFGFLSGIFILAGLVLLWAAFNLQIRNGSAYAAEAKENRLAHQTIFAERGLILDRNGTKLAWNEYSPDLDYGRRVYLPVSGFAHVIGYAKAPAKDSNGIYYQERYIGRDGVERIFDDPLGGMNGKRVVEVNARGAVISESEIEPPRAGDELILSIDADLQAKLHEEIAELARRVGFSGGAGVMLDVTTGEIIVLTSYPEFSPQQLTDGTDKTAIAAYLNDAEKPFLNRVVSGLYTPGSIVKPFIATAALTEGLIDPKKKILSTGSISIPNPYFPDKPSVFRDWRAHGWVDMRDALAVSSDVYFYAVGGGYEDQPGLGIDRIEAYLRRFGFGSQTGFIFPGESDGIIPTPAWKEATFNGDPWRLGDTYNTAIGQYGFQITPLQAARAIAAIANGGTLVAPTIQKNAPHAGDATSLTIDDALLQIVREGMREGVLRGTAAALNVPGIEVAAKTGTAELGASKRFVNSWVVGFFPAARPRYAFAIIMERGPATNLVGSSYVAGQFLQYLVATAPEYTR